MTCRQMVTAVWSTAVRRLRCIVVACLSLAIPASVAGAPANAYTLERVGGFDRTVDIVSRPSAPRLLYVVEKAGVVRVLRDGTPLGKPFLDIRGLVRAEPDPGAGGEEGLLSIAFPPDHAKSRLFYAMFVNNAGNVEIDEFKLRAGTALVGDPASRRRVLTIVHPFAANHNGGQLHFDAAGLLYISIGDGADGTGDQARRLDSLLGKLLRIDPRKTARKPYRIPPSNPFVGKTGRDEIYAYGLRNPWKFSLDGVFVTVADVGQSRQEEVNMLRLSSAAGVNFGWPQYEGRLIFDQTRPGPARARPPLFVYGHDRGCAIIGGFVVRDPGLPKLAGRYLYADFCEGVLRSFRPNVKAQTVSDDRPLGVSLPFPTTFGRGADGQVYVADETSLFRLEP